MSWRSAVRMPSAAASPMAIAFVCTTNVARSSCVPGSMARCAAGVVGAQLGWAKLSDAGLNINVLTSDRLTDLGGGATFYSTLVEVERVPETSCHSEG